MHRFPFINRKSNDSNAIKATGMICSLFLDRSSFFNFCRLALKGTNKNNVDGGGDETRRTRETQVSSGILIKSVVRYTNHKLVVGYTNHTDTRLKQYSSCLNNGSERETARHQKRRDSETPKEKRVSAKQRDTKREFESFGSFAQQHCVLIALISVSRHFNTNLHGSWQVDQHVTC